MKYIVAFQWNQYTQPSERGVLGALKGLSHEILANFTTECALIESENTPGDIIQHIRKQWINGGVGVFALKDPVAFDGMNEQDKLLQIKVDLYQEAIKDSAERP